MPAPLASRRPPRAPADAVGASLADLLPSFESLAARPYAPGVHFGWGLQPGERVLLVVDSWYDPRCLEAARQVIERHGCTATVRVIERGPVRDLEGLDEIAILPEMVAEGIRWRDEWARERAEGTFDKALWGHGGTAVPATAEVACSRAQTLPYAVLAAIDTWTWQRVRRATRVHITDPEGTDLWVSTGPAYFEPDRAAYRAQVVDRWIGTGPSPWRTYLPGHVLAKPWFFLDGDDGAGVAAGTMNHMGPYPAMALRVERSQVVDLAGGGSFGSAVRDLLERTRSTRYPQCPAPGLLHWWEAAIGTNPQVARPRAFPRGWACALPERVRSGVLHLGFGTVIGTGAERAAAEAGLPVGHYHVHLYFPTVTVQTVDGTEETVVAEGHLLALEAPEVRAVAAQFADPDELLREAWIPAVPGINVDGDYGADYAPGPLAWMRAHGQAAGGEGR